MSDESNHKGKRVYIIGKVLTFSYKLEPLPPPNHFDSSREIRNLGVGFYGFSQDDEVRRTQMRELSELRDETVALRKEVGKEKGLKRSKVDERRRILKEKLEKKRKRIEMDSGSSNAVDESEKGGIHSEVVDDDVDKFLSSI
jgi:hypothetical protein